MVVSLLALINLLPGLFVNLHHHAPTVSKQATMATNKERLDIAVVRRGLAPSRERARAIIMAGQVYVGDRLADKPGMLIPLDAECRLAETPEELKYVSRGGLKLEKALDAFQLRPEGLVALDVGASTGGFTHCLLEWGARRVYAVDV